MIIFIRKQLRFYTSRKTFARIFFRLIFFWFQIRNTNLWRARRWLNRFVQKAPLEYAFDYCKHHAFLLHRISRVCVNFWRFKITDVFLRWTFEKSDIGLQQNLQIFWFSFVASSNKIVVNTRCFSTRLKRKTAEKQFRRQTAFGDGDSDEKSRTNILVRGFEFSSARNRGNTRQSKAIERAIIPKIRRLSNVASKRRIENRAKQRFEIQNLQIRNFELF